MIGELTFKKEHFPTAQDRGLFSPDGRLLFIAPDQEVIRDIQNRDGRFIYFPLSLPTAEETDAQKIFENPAIFERWNGRRATLHNVFDATTISWFNGEFSPPMNTAGAAVNLANGYFLEQQLEGYIAAQFDPESIALRGTACYLDTKPNSPIGISTPEEILQMGREQFSARNVGITPFVGGEIASRTSQWLFDHPAHLREDLIGKGYVEEADKIFPILLIYNKSGFGDAKLGYSTAVPNDVGAQSRLIRQAILLDFPLSRRMIRDIKA